MPDQDQRPNPDELLQRISASSRGKLKLYIGMAAGVGKTYAMLSDALIKSRGGEDILLGYLEPHGRKETESLARELKTLPTRSVSVGSATFQEFDLDAAVALRPKVVLVDELAHTNAEGCRHRKRWQDVEELLSKGIDVFTTINIQHFESLRDIVAQITGIVVQETVPDAVIQTADDIEIIDLPPRELIARLREGRIYPADRAERALENFFQEDKLTALRELTLRMVAERVDAQMHKLRMRGSEVWPSRERVLVCVGPSANAVRLVRNAKRYADSLHAPLLAVSLESPQYLMRSERDKARATQALKMAESLGAETLVRSSSDMVSDLIALAVERNVTTIVLGKSIRPRWLSAIRASFVDELIAKSKGIHFYVISGAQGPAPRSSRDDQPVDRLHALPVFALMAITTALCFLLSRHVEPTNLVMLYLAQVAWISFRYGRRDGILASLLSVALFDFCFVPPHLTFAVADLEYLITFAVMLAISLIINALTSRLKAQTVSLLEREHFAQELYEFGKTLLVQSNIEELSKAISDHTERLFQSKAVLILGKDPDSVAPQGTRLPPQEWAVGSWTFEHNSLAGCFTDTLPGAQYQYHPIDFSQGNRVVLGLQLKHDLGIREKAVFETMKNQIALALERIHLEQSSKLHEMVMEKEKLRNTFLTSISHDLRTPLTSISGFVEHLLSLPSLAPFEARSDLQNIAQETQRLRTLIENILSIARLDSEHSTLQKEWCSIEELLGSALSRVKRESRTVHIQNPEELYLIEANPKLLEQLFQNLFENFVRHTTSSAHLEVTISANKKHLEVVFQDNGSGIPPGEETKVFERFQRSNSGNPDGGLGLGLAICQAIVNAHHGVIYAEPAVDSGARFVVRFPLPRHQPDLRTEEFTPTEGKELDPNGL